MQSLEQHFDCIRILYSCTDIQNQVPDGDEEISDFPGDPAGLSLQFKNVTFKYPQSSKLALEGVSFTIEPGQLCVVVGRNGSGKSSIVKLISRLYDCTGGMILVENHPVQQFRLTAYRRLVSTLPQEFTFFPLTVAENIGLGDPEHAEDHDRILKAAESGGAIEFIERDLADGFRTRLKGPSAFHIHSGDDRFSQWANKEVQKHRATSLSGGQWQKLALSRTFMRSSDVYLFQRLRDLRGKKTMLFVTHRFGHLTRTADKIIVMEAGQVLEQGTHSDLLAKEGLYARMYNSQAMAFSTV
ncbi:P-loop containing nucleoside triphosphate hydrolase protein [Dacryopinax primogenitus]|uniref:p-loop containing nucleoside triphosphate hydrolase protein n=1 Tax=Dacryopinax primogenitus (strain DJM 731) TaxID=1858805 RepID=M5G099_DACPD|nr:P-loop containing nucleoside triphosphate hydrolase protein [Dacryopinax primogenitus]EJU02174.1 P-loop containing nucleoside triphosphate hydrolase protein [Dacryopinax primogenitus]